MKKKPVSAKLAKRHAFFGKIDKTATGFKKTDLVQTKTGRIVSKEKPPWQEVALDRSLSEGPKGTQDQGFRSHQEGHSTLQEGQGASQPVSSNSMRNLLQ